MNSKRIPLSLKIAVFAAIVLAIYGVRFTANAEESICVSREEAVEILLEKYGEAPAFRALSKSRFMWEWYANRETGTWTAVLTQPTGKTCYIDSGDNWRDVAPKPAGQEG